jgi:mevalonate kinase
MILSVPGKTFLVGEYLALVGGPSILLSTGPRFSLHVQADEAADLRPGPFHAQSPAGKYLVRHQRDLSRFQFEFSDPHAGKGGLGASSAQWVLLHALRKGIYQGELPIRPEEIDWSALLDEYRTCAWSGEGAAPSGADVVSQLCGGVTLYDGREFKARRLDWSFSSLSFTLVRTGEKLATHEHLKGPQAAPHEALRACVSEARTAFESSDESRLVRAVGQYAEALAESGRVAPATLKLLADIRTQSEWALAAKGCGAMGADVILILHDASSAGAAKAWASGRGLEVCGGLADLEAGLVSRGD